MIGRSIRQQIFPLLPQASQRELRKMAQLRPYFRGQKHLIIPCLLLVPITATVQFSLPLILEAVVNKGILPGSTSHLIFYSLLFLGGTVLSYAAQAGQSLLSVLLIQKLIFGLRGHLIHHILQLKPAYHDTASSGSLLTRATHDFDSISDSLNHGVLNTIVGLSSIIGHIVALLVLDMQLALISLLTVPLASYAIMRISKIIRSETHKARKKLARLNAFTAETLYQSPVIKLFGAENQSQKRHHSYNKEFQKSQLKVVVYDALLYSFIEGLSAITIGLTLWLLAGEYLGITAVNPGVVVAFVKVLSELFSPLKQLGATITMLQGFFTSLDRILGLLSLRHFIEGSRPFPPAPCPPTRELITFKEVSFRYNHLCVSSPPAGPPSSPPAPWVLQDVSFSVAAGSTCALVGATGSGKTTIAKLLTKLYDNYQGSIRIKGAELRELDGKDLGHHIALVRQDLTLFAGTVEFNISLGREGVSRDDVVRAAQRSGAHRFISGWPQGYDQNILESGLNLSHGEKQLLSFTRALCKNPEIIILDEATSAMDPVTEQDLKEVMSYLSLRTTMLIIAHKLTTIQHCQKIIVIGDGTVLEQGSHQELLKHQGAYYHLIQSRENLENQS